MCSTHPALGEPWRRTTSLTAATLLGLALLVTGSSSDVFGLGGDDLVCVRGSGGSSNLFDVDAGAGIDVVDTTAMHDVHYVDVVLGDGADTVRTGEGNDRVTTGGEGDDTLVTGMSGTRQEGWST